MSHEQEYPSKSKTVKHATHTFIFSNVTENFFYSILGRIPSDSTLHPVAIYLCFHLINLCLKDRVQACGFVECILIVKQLYLLTGKFG